MYFMVLVRDRPNALANRLEYRPRHVDFWVGKGDPLKVGGAMLSEGPDAEPVGSSFLIEADSAAEVRALLAEDPFMQAGVFSEDILIQPVRPAIGAWLPD